MGAITDEKSREALIDFSFLPEGEAFEATIYADAPNAHWETNPQAYTITKKKVTNKTKMKQYLAPGGGAAISVKKIAP